MAIRVTYNSPLSATLAAAGGVSAGGQQAVEERRRLEEEARRRQQEQQAAELRSVAELQQVYNQRAAQQQQAAGADQAYQIQTALQYQKLQDDREASLARQQQDKARFDASSLMDRQQLGQRQAEFAAEQGFREQEAAKKDVRSEQERQAVQQLIGSVFTDPAEKMRAELLYKATGRLPEEILVPRQAGGGAGNATLDLTRRVDALNTFLRQAVDDYGDIRPGFNPSDVVRAQQQLGQMVTQQQQQVPQQQPAAPIQSSQQVTASGSPAERNAVARQQVNASPAVRQTFDSFIRQQYSASGMSDMMPFDQYQQAVAKSLGTRGPLDDANARSFYQMAKGDKTLALVMALAAGWIDPG